MVAINHRYRVVVFPIHKNASTWVKHLMYRLDTGRDFVPDIAPGVRVHIHRLYPFSREEKWERYYAGYTSLAIVRDPIRRFLSAYADRVVALRTLHEADTASVLGAQSLPLDPDVNEFVRNFQAYRKANLGIRRHTYRQASQIGDFVRRIDHVLPIERAGEFRDILARLSGEDLPHLEKKNEGTKVAVGELDASSLAFLRDHYAADYDMLHGIYEPPRAS